MALVRALEESLRDSARLYFSSLALPSAYSTYLLPTYFLPTSYLLPTYSLPTSGLLMATSGLLMATPRGLPPPTSGLLMATPAYPTRESARMARDVARPSFADCCRCLPIFTDFLGRLQP